MGKYWRTVLDQSVESRGELDLTTESLSFLEFCDLLFSTALEADSVTYFFLAL